MASSVLKNITVLVTRPGHQAGKFCRLIDENGGQAIAFPVIEIRPVKPKDEEISALSDRIEYLVFTSANAIFEGMLFIRSYLSDQLASCRITAIGQATAKALEYEGMTPGLVPPSPFNSEALLALPEMQQVAGKRFLIVKGKGGRQLLGEELIARGAQVRYLDVYERIRPDRQTDVLDELVNCPRVVISITSVEGLQNLFSIVTEKQAQWLRSDARFLVAGKRVASKLEDFSVRLPPIVADDPTDDAMFRRLVESVGSL